MDYGRKVSVFLIHFHVIKHGLTITCMVFYDRIYQGNIDSMRMN